MIRRWIDDLGMIFLALVLAVIVWIVAAQEENPIEKGEYQETIPVEVRNQPEGTTFFPEFEERVKLIIRAPESSWRDLRADKFTAWIDLQGRDPGDFDVPVQIASTDANVLSIEARPEAVPVRLKKEVSSLVPVQVQIFGSAALGYTLKTNETVVKPEFVAVIGPAQIVNQVTKASIDLPLRDLKETFVGTRRVVPKQANGETVGFVDIQPSTVEITIPVVQKTGFNDVVVRPVLTGTVATGYWVSNVTLDPTTVTLVGDPAVVSQVSGYVDTMPLDITEATGHVIERMPLDLPEGASTVGIQGVLVTVNIQPLQGRVTILRPPVVRGLNPDLSARISPRQVAVTLIGPLPRLNALADEDVYVYVELVEKGIGEYRVNLTPLVPEGLEVVSILPEIVNVQISTIPPTPTATATATPTLLPTPTATAVLTATPTITGTTSVTTSVDVTTTVTPTSTVPAVSSATPELEDSTPSPVPVPPSPTPIATPTSEIK
jgi:YbbR domain-containing protein